VQAEDAIISQCKHLFDRECIRQYLEVQQMRGHKVSLSPGTSIGHLADEWCSRNARFAT
jgi:hypothetical protein